jgi:hypothetical protein
MSICALLRVIVCLVLELALNPFALMVVIVILGNVDFGKVHFDRLCGVEMTYVYLVFCGFA